MPLASDPLFQIQAAHLKPAERLYLTRLLRRVYPVFPKKGRVLDAGCGGGHVSQVLPEWGCEVIGVDVACQPEAWEQRGRAGLTFQEGSAEALSFPDAYFEGALVKDAFHHMGNPVQALAELQRVVKPGGPIVVIEANRYNPVFFLHLTMLGEHNHFSRARLRSFLKRADPEFAYTMAESRCLPWNQAWLLKLLAFCEEAAERVRVLDPWLTYQIAVVRGKGRAS